MTAQQDRADELGLRVINAGGVSSARVVDLVTDGMQHEVIVIDGIWVARFPRDTTAAQSLRHEVTVLEYARQHVGGPMPSLQLLDGFSLHRLLPGRPTTRGALERMPQEAADRVVTELGTLLRSLHTAPIDESLPTSVTKSVDEWQRLYDRAQQVIGPHLWRHQRDWLDELFAPVVTEAITLDYRPSIVHADLASYHVLHDPQTGQLSGLIDFGVAGVGDPALDLACLFSSWGESRCTALLDPYPELSELAARARFYAAALPVEWALAGLEGGAPEMLLAHLGHVANDLNPRQSPFGG
jgi:aminoglycoside 2''-phosphotransferase